MKKLQVRLTIAKSRAERPTFKCSGQRHEFSTCKKVHRIRGVGGRLLRIASFNNHSYKQLAIASFSALYLRIVSSSVVALPESSISSREVKFIMVPPLIALEEHFIYSGMLDADRYAEQLKWVAGLKDKLADLGPMRLSEMDRGKVNLQVISHAAGDPNLQHSIDANNQLAKAVKENSSRFAGFATLPMSAPDDAAKELKRVVEEHGFLGALIDNRTDGNTYYDDRKFWTVFEMAQKLDVPIYIHPTWPSQEQKDLMYTGNFSQAASVSMGASGFGWHQDVGLHVLRLFAAGLFDEYPKLKIIIGHFGEMLPFMLERITLLSKRWGERKRDFQTVYDENIIITTSGVWSVHPMATVLRNTKLENILFSVDYPFADSAWGLTFMEDLEKSGLVTPEQLEAIAYKNAERVLKIKLKT